MVHVAAAGCTCMLFMGVYQGTTADHLQQQISMQQISMLHHLAVKRAGYDRLHTQ
jgi:hypothetical protein